MGLATTGTFPPATVTPETPPAAAQQSVRQFIRGSGIPGLSMTRAGTTGCCPLSPHRRESEGKQPRTVMSTSFPPTSHGRYLPATAASRTASARTG